MSASITCLARSNVSRSPNSLYFRNSFYFSRIMKYTFRFDLLSAGLLILLGLPSVAPAQEGPFPGWRHYSVDPVLPASSWGTGGTALADFDGDGDLDAAISRRNTRSAYWYERVNDSLWIQHLMGAGDPLEGTLGTTPIDMNRDGWTDVAYNGIWFLNPGNLDRYPDTPWPSYPIKAGGHDATTVDMDGDGLVDLLVYDGNKLAWYNPSEALREVVISSGHHDHGGIAPRGYGDLDGDGDPDVMIAGLWFENPGEGVGDWHAHKWPFETVENPSYGPSIRAWIADMNGDGENDIVYSHCDTGGSHVYWVMNLGNGMEWKPVRLKDPPTLPGDVEGTGSFHSLGVADFNQDGAPDIFAGEQEDPDVYMEADGKVAMKPRGLKERGVIWYSTGGKHPAFEPQVIQRDNPGWHDAQLGDVDGDGDIDIVSKVWNADGPAYHMDYWSNRLK
jgi:hypothetical protein